MSFLPALTRRMCAWPPMRNSLLMIAISRQVSVTNGLKHDPEKHALGPRPDGWVPVFPRDKREAFARRSCSNKRIERDDDSKKSHPALGTTGLLNKPVPEPPPRPGWTPKRSGKPHRKNRALRIPDLALSPTYRARTCAANHLHVGFPPTPP